MSGIRPDAWIARMAREHGMIEPFSDRQVREGVISYGLSSYGYDLRVSDEYKIFTNVYTATVDPKAFDPRSFVDFKGDVCIVPPNSFALARSIEYFRIPRNVLTICVGKSTYARCFAGDTRVALVDGTSPTMEEMVVRHEAGEMFWGYSMSSYGRIQVALLDAPRKVGREPLVEIALDDDSRIRCTPDHEFILRDGRTAAAEELQPGTSLMPLYRNDPRGYEMVYQPLNGQMHPTHRLADEWNVRNGLYEDVEGTHRHHRDWDRRNNNPWNMERMDANEQRLRVQRFWREDEYAEARARLRIAHAASWTAERARQGERSRRAWQQASTGRRARQAAFSASRDRNHKVSSVTPLKGEHDVYCLTVPEGGNFALAAGVFTLNCGILVNVTPFEPEWEGHVTLEISNTTPLPAKIYSGEGLAQVLFFESDEPCDVSYKDRGGKYQAQRGVTLPRL